MTTTTINSPVALRGALTAAGLEPGIAFKTVLLLPDGAREKLLASLRHLSLAEIAATGISDLAEWLDVTYPVAAIVRSRFEAASR